jgi:hypothetical protein
MANNIPIKQVVYDKNSFSKVIDINFRELNNSQPVREEITIEEFFRIYEDVFFNIPKEGDIESHRFILNKEAEYLGVRFGDDIDIQALLEEITDLRRQLVNVESSNSRLIEQIPLDEMVVKENQQLLSDDIVKVEQLSLMQDQENIANNLLNELIK